jgi:GGDEF domain-containing protein
MLPVPPPYPEVPPDLQRALPAGLPWGRPEAKQPAVERRVDYPRPAPPARLVELADEAAFRRLMERECLSSRRRGQALSVLRLQASLPAVAGNALHTDLHTEMLAECARRLRSRVRATDEVLRWQGQHFAVLLQACEAVHAPAVLQRLCDFGSGPYRLGAQLLHLQVQGQLERCAQA